MVDINNYITEKLHLNKNIKKQYTYCPENKSQLKDLLHQLFRERGNEADLNDIDVSKITDMSRLFATGEYINMNFNISDWDVSNVTNMTEMFSECEKFNCDISSWDVSNVKYMNYMFYGCKDFEQNLSKWNVENVKRWNGFSTESGLGVATKQHLKPKFNLNNVK